MTTIEDRIPALYGGDDVSKETDKIIKSISPILCHDMMDWKELADRVLALERVISIIEDRHHPDSEWCPEAKEVLGG